MNDKKRKELDAAKAEVVNDATNLVMDKFIDLIMKEYGVVDPRSKNFCERQVFHQLWRALDESEWAVSQRAMI